MTLERNINSDQLDFVANLSARLTCNDIPAPTLHAAKRFLADTAAVTIAGVASPSTEGIIAAARLWDGSGPKQGYAFGTPDIKLSPANTAFVNGYKAHCLEWDGLHEGGVAIAFCTPFAAIAAECQQRDVSGDDFLAAFTLSAELFILLGLGSGSTARFFRPSAGGTITAALAVARCRNFSPEKTKQTLGLAYSMLSGTMQSHWEGTTTLAMQVGAAARNAIYAADLAENGIAAPVDIFSGKFGFFSIVEESGAFDDILAELGVNWRMPEVAFKPYPCGRATHGVLTILRELKVKSGLDENTITKARVLVPPLLSTLVNRPLKEKMSPGYARLCLPFIFGKFILNGDIDPRTFSDPVQPTDDEKRLARLLEIDVEPNRHPKELFPITLTITRGNGGKDEFVCNAPWGTPENPFTDTDLRDKIERCLEIGDLPVSARIFEEVFFDIENEKNVRDALERITDKGK